MASINKKGSLGGGVTFVSQTNGINGFVVAGAPGEMHNNHSKKNNPKILMPKIKAWREFQIVNEGRELEILFFN